MAKSFAVERNINIEDFEAYNSMLKNEFQAINQELSAKIKLLSIIPSSRPLNWDHTLNKEGNIKNAIKFMDIINDIDAPIMFDQSNYNVESHIVAVANWRLICHMLNLNKYVYPKELIDAK